MAPLLDIPAWYAELFPITDWPLYILCAGVGDIAYFDEVVGAYRIHDGGLVSSKPDNARHQLIEQFYRRMIKVMPLPYSQFARGGCCRYFYDWSKSYVDNNDIAMATSCFRRCTRSGGVGLTVSRRDMLRLGLRILKATLLKMTSTNNAAYRDTVSPAPVNARRPKWSVMVPVYNNCRHLRAALESVLAQDPGREFMQIEVVDDFSNDEPEKIIREVAGDRVSYFRQASNRGHIQNFHTCITRAKGEIVHLLHGDDLVRQGFYKELQEGFDREPAIGAAFCQPVYIDDMGGELSIDPLEQSNSGPLVDAAIRLASEQKIMTPCIAVRRDVYERLGGFDRRLRCSEDWEMWVRIAAQYSIWYVPQPLACYRIHRNSNTGRHIRNAKDAAYTRKAIDIFSSYLPRGEAKLIAGKARRTYAMSALRTADQLLQEGDWIGCFSQTKEAIRLHPSLRTVYLTVKMFVKRKRSLARPG